MKGTIYISMALFLGMVPTCFQQASAQRASELLKGMEYSTEAQVSASDGNTPLWLNANKYGLSSLSSSNGYFRAGVARPLSVDSARKWKIGYGVDLAAAYNYTSSFVVQQLYLDVKYKRVLLSFGSKERPTILKNNELSSGSQTVGINARPVPQLRIELPEYWSITGKSNWLAIKGHIAFGRFTDNKWQKKFAGSDNAYTQNVLFHSKAGYLRLGDEEKFPLQGEFGLEMASQFSGTAYNLDALTPKLDMESGLKSYWHAFTFGGSDPTDQYSGGSGNTLGSWIFSLSYKFPTWKIRAYYDHFFEDHSMMLMYGSSGYGTGVNYNDKESGKFVGYKMKDGLYGVEVTLPSNRFVSSFVYEYLYTKYQSGPVYHDHTAALSDNVAGIDNYYNNLLYCAWQHWGQVMGNPLYRSPLYNTDGKVRVENNRFVAHHFGISGDPIPSLHYRLLFTYQEGWGTYQFPLADKEYNTSFLAEATYSIPMEAKSKLRGWIITGGFGFDHGKLLGNNTGCQITIRKIGLLNL